MKTLPEDILTAGNKPEQKAYRAVPASSPNDPPRKRIHAASKYSETAPKPSPASLPASIPAALYSDPCSSIDIRAPKYRLPMAVKLTAAPLLMSEEPADIPFPRRRTASRNQLPTPSHHQPWPNIPAPRTYSAEPPASRRLSRYNHYDLRPRPNIPAQGRIAPPPAFAAARFPRYWPAAVAEPLTLPAPAG